MHLAMNMGYMAKEGFFCAALEETQWIIKRPCAEVREEMKLIVQFHGDIKVNAAPERHPAMVYNTQPDAWLPYHNGTGKNTQTSWRHRDTGPLAPQSMVLSPRQSSLPKPPPVSPGDSDGHESDEIASTPSRMVYIYSPHSNMQFFNHNPQATDSKRN
jgi:hypothetical protein